MSRPKAYDPTFNTKWGRITSQEWFWRRRQEELERWWTPEVEAYVIKHWPTPEQIEANRRAWAQQKRAQRNRTATAPPPPRPSPTWPGPIVPALAQALDSEPHPLSFPSCDHSPDPSGAG